jgi:hypothetical protein
VRRAPALAALGLVLVAGGVAAGLVLALGGGDDEKDERAAYLAEIATICRTYERRLARVPVPSAAAPGEIVEAIGQALPLLEERAEKARSVDPPSALGARVARFFELTERTIERLEAARAAARKRDVVATQEAMAGFLEAREAARAESERIGFRC